MELSIAMIETRRKQQEAEAAKSESGSSDPELPAQSSTAADNASQAGILAVQ